MKVVVLLCVSNVVVLLIMTKVLGCGSVFEKSVSVFVCMCVCVYVCQGGWLAG